MNTITKLFSAVACAVIFLGCSVISAVDLHSVYDSYYFGGYTPSSSINQFDTDTFRGTHTATWTVSSFSALPTMNSQSVIFTLLGARSGNNDPYVVTEPCVNGAYVYLYGTFPNPPSSAIVFFRYAIEGFPLAVPYTSVGAPLASLVGATYTLEIKPTVAIVGGGSADFPFLDSLDLYIPSTDWKFYEINVVDSGYKHIAASFRSYWDGIPSAPLGTSDSFFDVFFDIAIPMEQGPSVPEPQVYLLIGSMLALAYVLGRKKAKEQG